MLKLFIKITKFLEHFKIIFFQDREVIIGDELPFLKDCEFHPDKLKTVAKNIVTFLEQNVMQQGHTYWLYKGRDF